MGTLYSSSSECVHHFNNISPNCLEHMAGRNVGCTLMLSLAAIHDFQQGGEAKALRNADNSRRYMGCNDELREGANRPVLIVFPTGFTFICQTCLTAS